MRRLKFRKRQTIEKIIVVIKNVQKINLREYKRTCLRRGEYDTGFHYLLHPNGLLEADRPEDCVGYYRFADFEKAIYILTYSYTKGLSEAQILTLDRLATAKGVEWQVLKEI